MEENNEINEMPESEELASGEYIERTSNNDEETLKPITFDEIDEIVNPEEVKTERKTPSLSTIEKREKKIKSKKVVGQQLDIRPKFNGLKFICNKCGNNLSIQANYYKVNTSDYCIYPIFPVCKKCLFEQFEIDVINLGVKEAIRKTLRQLDKPYNTHIIEPILEKKEPREALGDIIRILSNSNFYGKTYDDSDFVIDEKQKVVDNDIFDVNDEPKVKMSATEFIKWQSYGLEPDEIDNCADYYNRMMDKYEFDSLNDELAVEQLAVLNTGMRKAFKEGDIASVQKLRSTISSIENDLHISAKQKKNDASSDTFGNFVKMIENDMPIPEPKDEFKDVDGIWNLVKRYIIGYLPVMLGKVREEDVLQEDANIIDDVDE